MSVKQDVEYIKQELGAEERFLSGLAHAEKFWKKFQKPLIGIGLALILGGGGLYAFNLYRNSQIDSANIALNQLFLNSNDKIALETLKAKDTKLFEAYSLYASSKEDNASALNALGSSSALFVGELSSYQASALERNETKLLKIGEDKTAIMRNPALIDAGVLALQRGDAKTAQSSFAKVSQDSLAKPEAISLEHFSQSAKK